MSLIKKILIIKMSSMGDVIHTFPAITDAIKALPNLQIDWVVEENFADLPLLHPNIHRVIPIALRRWRKKPFKRQTWAEIRKFMRQLRCNTYDIIIDAQGLGKSGIISRVAKGKIYGLSRSSARESWASSLYQVRIPVEQKQHAIERLRILFSKALDYTKPNISAHYGLAVERSTPSFLDNKVPYCLFFHGTTWPTKQWPLSYWTNLAKKVAEKGFYIGLPWGNKQEREQAQQIAMSHTNCFILPQLKLTHLVSVIQQAAFVISVDTGLAHLAAALDKKAIVLYGPTDPDKVGTVGKNQIHIMSPKLCSSQCLKKDCTYSRQESCMAEVKVSLFESKIMSYNKKN